VNFRNHRKIVVVDGKRAFVGGHNVGDEYVDGGRFNAWRDTHVALEGPIVQAIQIPFAEDWYWAAQERLSNLDWDPKPSTNGNTAAICFPTGPADTFETCALFFLTAINGAKERIWIASPYFVPDEAIMYALQLAAIRGVDVRILLPNDPDHKLVYLASFSYLQNAEKAGVKIYRYLPGFMHQKVVLVDQEYSAVGTANLDNRSFRLNFEIMMLFEDPDLNRDVAAMLEKDFKNSRLVPATDYTDRNFLFRLGVQCSRLTAPIL
jgi:cardiolipin synthase